MTDKPKILVCTSNPEGVPDYLRERFIGWDIVEVNIGMLDKLQGEGFSAVWIDEAVKYAPIIQDIPEDYFHPDQFKKRWEERLQALVIDKPTKPAKLRKQKHTTPFWANDYRRK